jgi:hypothetical protein
MRCFSFIFPLLLAAIASASVTITTATLPNGTVQVPYTATILTSGGCTPMTWKISAGILPSGVTSAPTNNTRSLALSGTPTTAAIYPFTVTVTGCGKHTSSRSYTVTIQPAAVHTVDLSWAESGTVVGYNVYRGTVSGGPYAKINLGGLIAATLYTDSTVANATTYYYVTTAVDNTGAESVYSNQATAQVP